MTRFVFSAVFLLGLTAPLAAQPIDITRLQDVFEAEPTVEINLRGSLLRLAAEATRAEEPDAALMLDGLRAVTVRIYPLNEQPRDAIAQMNSFGRDFEREGWFTMVRIRPNPNDEDSDDGDVWVYVRDDGDAFDGLAVMAVDHGDKTAAFVHIDGTIDPAQVGALTRRFADVDIDSDRDDDED